MSTDKLSKDIEKLIKKYSTNYGDKGHKLDRFRVRLLQGFYYTTENKTKEYKIEYPTHTD